METGYQHPFLILFPTSIESYNLFHTDQNLAPSDEFESMSRTIALLPSINTIKPLLLIGRVPLLKYWGSWLPTRPDSSPKTPTKKRGIQHSLLEVKIYQLLMNFSNAEIIYILWMAFHRNITVLEKRCSERSFAFATTTARGQTDSAAMLRLCQSACPHWSGLLDRINIGNPW